MATHNAVVTIGLKAPLAIVQVPTPQPIGDQILIRVEWTASTPLDLHQNDGGLLVKHPQRLGDGVAGTVMSTGPEVKRLKVGDKVFGFAWRTSEEKAHQDFCLTNEWLMAKLPEGFEMKDAVTLPNNFVTVFHSLTKDLGFELPWPKSGGREAVPGLDSRILIWGGASSVGMFAIQVLKYYGYRELVVVASGKHHKKLRSLGARWTVDYKDENAVDKIQKAGSQEEGKDIAFVLDCIGSMNGSVTAVSRIAKRGSRVAILLPIIMRDSAEGVDPIYELDPTNVATWDDGVDVRGVRTHFYLENEFFKYHLQPDIMPTMLKEGIIEPNAVKLIEGDSLLERAQKAMDTLRRKEASGERLVWRVADN